MNKKKKLDLIYVVLDDEKWQLGQYKSKGAVTRCIRKARIHSAIITINIYMSDRVRLSSMPGDLWLELVATKEKN